MQELMETGIKIFVGLIILASATRRGRRRGRPTYEYQNHFMHRPGGSRGSRDGAPSFVIGGFMVALGFLLLMVMIGPQLLVNMGLAMAFCLAPLAIVGAIVVMALRNAAKQGSGSTSASSRDEPAFGALFGSETTAKPESVPKAETKTAAGTATKTAAPPIEPFVMPRVTNLFRSDREKPPHPPAYYRDRATAYRQRIQNLSRSRRKGPLAATFATILPRLERWEERVTQLVNRLANFESDRIIQRDIQEAPQNIARLGRQIEKEGDPVVREQMQKTLEGYEEQKGQLEALVRLMRRTRLQLDDTLASMGTIYSQVQMLDAMDIDGARATHIADEIEEEVARLNDLLSAFGETNGNGREDFLTEAARRIRLGRNQSAG
jgi:hypothetical protein